MDRDCNRLALMQFISDTLLDGTLLNALDGVNDTQNKVMIYQKKVALGSLLQLLRQNRELWPMVIEEVQRSVQKPPTKEV